LEYPVRAVIQHVDIFNKTNRAAEQDIKKKQV
jgi:hypothetical protein